MVNVAQRKTYDFIRDEIGRLRSPNSYVPLALNRVSELTDVGTRALFHVCDARVFIEESGEVVDGGLPDCSRYADGLLRYRLPAIAADLLREGNLHKPFLDINSHTPESFESYLRTGIPFQQEFPFPIAIVSRKMGNEANGMRSFFLLLDLFEAIIRFIVLVQVADVMRGTQQAQAEVLAWCRARSNNPRLSFSRLYLGDWVSMFCPLRQFSNNKPFLTEIQESKIDEAMLSHFVKLRNDLRGHGKTLAEAYYRTIFEQNIGKIEQLLHAVSFLKNYWMVKPLSIEHDGAHSQVSAWKLMGDNPIFDKRNIPSDNPLPTNEVIYLKGTPLSRDLEPLVLDPYVILEICNECKREELLLFDGFSWENITYLGYETCPKPHKPSYPYLHKLPRALRDPNHR